MNKEKLKLALEQGYEYFKFVKACDSEREQLIESGDFFSSGKNINRAMFGYFVDFTQNNGFPKVISDKEYKHLDRKELYHGFSKYNHGLKLLSHWKYHYGTGFINGIFFTENPEMAYEYTIAITGNDQGIRDRNRVLKIKLDSNKGIEYSTIKYYSDMAKNFEATESDDKDIQSIYEIQKFVDGIEDMTSAEEYLNTIIKPSTLAVLLGYEYINALDNIVVLSRQSLCVSETMFNTFLTNALEM